MATPRMARTVEEHVQGGRDLNLEEVIQSFKFQFSTDYLLKAVQSEADYGDARYHVQRKNEMEYSNQEFYYGSIMLVASLWHKIRSENMRLEIKLIIYDQGTDSIIDYPINRENDVFLISRAGSEKPYYVAPMIPVEEKHVVPFGTLGWFEVKNYFKMIEKLGQGIYTGRIRIGH